MEDLNEKQLNQESKQVHLLRSEKEVLRRRILSAPLIQTRRFFSPIHFMKIAAGSLAAIMVVTVPLTYAAQQSKPGDALYRFEVSVLEPIEEMAHVSAESKAVYHMERLVERLEELQDTPSGDLIDDEKVAVIENITEHVEEFLNTVSENSDEREVIDQLVDASAVVKAHKKVAHDLYPEISTITNLDDAVSGELQASVDEYTQSQSSADVAAAVQDEIGDANILAQEDENAGNDQEVKDGLADAAVSVKNGEFGDALQSILDVQIELKTQDYIDQGAPEVAPDLVVPASSTSESQD